jgi:hypothetical protein
MADKDVLMYESQTIFFSVSSEREEERKIMRTGENSKGKDKKVARKSKIVISSVGSRRRDSKSVAIDLLYGKLKKTA